MTGLRRMGAVAVGVLAVVAASAGTASGTDDTYFSRQWALEQIGAPQAWSRSTGSGITIGIVDTGIDLGHPDLVGKAALTANCLDRACTAGGADDGNGHGTIVSGIAAAVTGNARGVAGVAPDARLAVAKVLDSSGEGRVEDIENGIRWAVDNGARVVNLSLGDPDLRVSSVLGTPLRSAIEYAWSRGAVSVLAAGNYATGVGDLGPENYGNINALVVGATDRSGAVPSYSSSIGNAKWGLVAPGGGGSGGPESNVISTFPVASGGSGYVSSAGTSMAAAHVSGAVALLLAQGLSPGAAVSRILSTLDKGIPCGSGCQGRLNVGAAVGADAMVATTAPATARAAGAPRTTAAPPSTTQPPATTTTSSTTSTTSTTSTVPPEPADAPELANPVPILAGPAPADRNPAVVATATVLVLAMGGAVGSTGVRRLRADGRP